jgi:hypothetical protein
LEFYLWLHGIEKSSRFSVISAEVYESFNFPKSASDKDIFKKIYSLLCSYAHKPLLEESITSIKQTNKPEANARVLEYWANIVNDTLRLLIDLLVACKPQILFPKDVWRKFGFNYPIGIYFDHSNYIPFEQWLGKKKLIEYKELYSKNDDLIAILRYYDEKASLTNGEILESWRGEENIEDSPSDNAENKILHRWASSKATQRLQSIIFSYMINPHNIHWKDGEATVTSIKFE